MMWSYRVRNESDHVGCSKLLNYFFFKQKTAYEMRISDWSSDVCSSDLGIAGARPSGGRPGGRIMWTTGGPVKRARTHPRNAPIGHPVPQRCPEDRKSVV